MGHRKHGYAGKVTGKVTAKVAGIVAGSDPKKKGTPGWLSKGSFLPLGGDPKEQADALAQPLDVTPRNAWSRPGRHGLPNFSGAIKRAGTGKQVPVNSG